MEIPSGCRNSLPSPKLKHSGNAPRMAAVVVMMIGRNRITAAWKIASRLSILYSRSACSAKSIMRMAFFFTMPISKMTPISAMIVKGMPNMISASTAPTPADGSVDRIVSGCMKLS
jgi:hypothetical protein